jgi:hypothetical protein
MTTRITMIEHMQPFDRKLCTIPNGSSFVFVDGDNKVYQKIDMHRAPYDHGPMFYVVEIGGGGKLHTSQDIGYWNTLVHLVELDIKCTKVLPTY